jgi:hypothetical protein
LGCHWALSQSIALRVVIISANAWRQGLNAEGFFEGQNVAIEYRWGEGAIVADLAGQGWPCSAL